MCPFTSPVNFITLAVWRREKQVSSVRLDYYVSLCETFPSTTVLTSFLTRVREDRCRRREKGRERERQAPVILLSDISKEMAIDSYDIVSTLQALGMMKYWKGKHIILKKQVSVPLCYNLPRIYVNIYVWLPFIPRVIASVLSCEYARHRACQIYRTRFQESSVGTRDERNVTSRIASSETSSQLTLIF